MIHIGTVHLNGREYSLELNRAEQAEKDSESDSAKPTARKNPKAGRSEVVPLNPNRRFVGTHNAIRPNRNSQSIEEALRFAAFARKEQVYAEPAQTRWKFDRERLVRSISCFLSWCFPVRGFHSPLQRILYLSVEGPKSKYRRRILLP